MRIQRFATTTFIGGVHQRELWSVTAENNEHHSTIRAAIIKTLADNPCPDYVDSVTGKHRPGKWSAPYQTGRYQRTRVGRKVVMLDIIVLPA